jgi:hypothetical protein
VSSFNIYFYIINVTFHFILHVLDLCFKILDNFIEQNINTINVFSSSSNRSFRGAEYQRLNVRVLISKLELRMITFKEYQFQNTDNTLLYNRKDSCDITIMFVSS